MSIERYDLQNIKNIIDDCWEFINPFFLNIQVINIWAILAIAMLLYNQAVEKLNK
jgi:hypothetical protein